MADEAPQLYEQADEEHLGGYFSFGRGVIYTMAFVLALLLWMFVALVVGVGFWTSILWIFIVTILAIIGSALVSRLIL